VPELRLDAEVGVQPDHEGCADLPPSYQVVPVPVDEDTVRIREDSSVRRHGTDLL
jgi:hypothetical protein